jgi:hypothetical protein
MAAHKLCGSPGDGESNTGGFGLEQEAPQGAVWLLWPASPAVELRPRVILSICYEWGAPRGSGCVGVGHSRDACGRS